MLKKINKLPTANCQQKNGDRVLFWWLKKHPVPIFFVTILLLAPLAGQVKYSLDEAFIVINYIEKLQAAQLKEYSGPFREIIVKENELNSYIAYLIDIDREEVMKELQLKIFSDNRIEGKIFIDLKGQKIPQMLRSEMNFYFSAKLDVKKKKIRVNINKLFLEDQEISTIILDLAIFVASKMSNTESGSINDWYALPFGIKDIKTKRGKALFYY